jgi:hypothetical protein
VALVRLARHGQANKIAVYADLAHRLGCGRNVRANRRQESWSDRFKMNRKQASKYELALGMLIALAFRNKTPAGSFGRAAVWVVIICCYASSIPNQHPTRWRRFYLAVQNQLRVLAEALQFVCAPNARWSVARRLPNRPHSLLTMRSTGC